MKKYELLCSDDKIIRVLEMQDDKVLVIDCVSRKMPVWMEIESLESYSECTMNELFEITGFTNVAIENLDSDQKKTMYERYTMIASLLPFVADDKRRSQIICSIVEEHKVSKQTIRNYLCLYLSYMEILLWRLKIDNSYGFLDE